MRNPVYLSLILLLFVKIALSQSDTIYSNNEKIICSVKEITPEAVKFCYPNEDVLNSLYKNTIQKIVFKSGRVQVFSESTALKKVTGPQDFENVTITKVENEVNGLFKLGDVSSKAKGTTEFSNQDRVKDRAYRKLKIEAAMLGGNTIFLTDSRTQGNKFGSEYESSQTSEASFAGVAYTNVLPNYENFKKMIDGKSSFIIITQVELWSGASDMTFKEMNQKLTVYNTYDENGFIMMKASYNDNKNDLFRVVNYDSTSFTLCFHDKSTVYNLKVIFQ